MDIHTTAPSVRSWINKGVNPLPDWVESHVAGEREQNGSFLVHTRVGRVPTCARVHVGHVAVLRDGVIYARDPGEAPELLSELEAVDQAAPIHPVGPGKSLDRSGCARARRTGQKIGERRLSYPPPIGAMPTIEWVHLERLSFDGSYQRSTDNEASRRLIASIAAKFDWRLCAPLVVSRRPDGSLVVIDGQHRTMAARKRRDIPQLPCCVFGYSGPEEEARMFITANRARKPMNRLDDFHAALAAADEDALEIQQLVADAGLKITRNTSSAAWKPGEIAFTTSIATTIRKHGAAIASAALTNIAQAFPGQKVIHSGSIFLGLVKILVSPPEGFDPDRLFAALQTRDAEAWGALVRSLKGGDTRAGAIREALLTAYGSATLN